MSDLKSDALTIRLGRDTRERLARAAVERELSPARIAKEVLENWLADQRKVEGGSIGAYERRSPTQSTLDPSSVYVL